MYFQFTLKVYNKSYTKYTFVILYNLKRKKMNKHKLKIIKMEENVHGRAKLKAYELGMTLQGYIKSLVNSEERVVGVYSLIKDDEIVYVGMSVNVYGRINTHRQNKTKDFDSFCITECSENELEENETALILEFDPKYNIKDSPTRVFKPGSKKLLWFTKDQLDLLEKLKEKTKLNNSEVVRKAMELYAEKELS